MLGPDSIVDCHRHLGGAISADFVWEAIQANGWHFLAESHEDVVESMTFAEDEKPNFHAFLRKFNILDHIRWTEELIDASIKQVCDDLIAEGVDYTWIRFSVNKYLTYIDWHRKDMIKFVRDRFNVHAPDRVGLVLAVKYESERTNQKQLLSMIDDSGVAESLVGIDLVGDETFYDYKFYGSHFREWAAAGKLLFAHVGESQPAENIMTAIMNLGVTEICHGIKALDGPNIIDYAIDNDVCFHMALTSNLLTGVVGDMAKHPIIDIIDSGVKTTIGTDDPVQCSTTIAAEYDLLKRALTDRYGAQHAERMVGIVAQTALDRISI